MSETFPTLRLSEDQIRKAGDIADTFLPPCAEPEISPEGDLSEIRQYSWRTRNASHCVRHNVHAEADLLLACSVVYTDDFGVDATSTTWRLDTQTGSLSVTRETGNVWEFEEDLEARRLTWQAEEGLGLHVADETDWNNLIKTLEMSSKHAQRRARFSRFGLLGVLSGRRTK